MDDIESATEFFTENHYVTVEYTLEKVCISKSSRDFDDLSGLPESNPIQISAGIRDPDHSHGLQFLFYDVEQAVILTEEVLALLVSTQRMESGLTMWA